jgi:benzoyl-CoA reductase/2-hydroxyglutaryl-CoA dehydratase subunit BcrC/BadD/HgdB
MEVFFTSPWIPAEWIKAHGLDPRGVWFKPEFGFGTFSVFAGICAFAEAAVRLAEAQPESAMIFSTHCDQLRRGFDSLDEKLRARVFLFNLPVSLHESAAESIFLSELERLSRFLIRLGGHLPDADQLAGLIERYSLARSRLLEAASWCPASQYAEAVARFHWDGSVSLPEPPPALGGSNPVRLAVVGGPLPQPHWELLGTIEHAGGRVVLNGTEAGERSLWPAAASSSSLGAKDLPTIMLRLARDYLAHCVEVYQRPNTRLYAWLKERLACRQVCGIVLWQYIGCDLWRAELQSLREAFGLPVLLLDANETAGGRSRHHGRIEAFLEALR